jgi:hypothetical protein
MRFSYFALLLMTASLSAQTPGDNTTAETPKSSSLRIGMHVSSEFDDNASFGTTNSGVKDVISTAGIDMNWDVVRPRWQWKLGYKPGFTKSYNISSYDSLSQTSTAELQHQWTRRLGFSVQSSYSLSNNPFDSLRQQLSAEDSQHLVTPNASALNASFRRNVLLTGGEVYYLLTRHSKITLGGDWSHLIYEDGTGRGHEFENTHSIGSDVAYSLQLSKPYTTGVSYRLQFIKAQTVSTDVLVHNVNWTNKFDLTPTMRIGLAFGPESSRTRRTGLSAAEITELSWAGEASYDWSKNDSGIGLTWSRGITDGAGLEGAVRQQSVRASARHALGKRSSVSVFASYNTNEGIGRSLIGDKFETLSAGVDYSRELSSRVNLSMAYWRVQELSSRNFLTVVRAGDHNRISASISYHFDFPVRF